MVKKIYLLRSVSNENYADFSSRIIDIGKSLATREQFTAIKITLTDQPPPTISIIPFKNKKVAAISVYSVQDDLAVRELDNVNCFRVDEAVPVRHSKTWPDLEHTPGVCLFTLFRKKPGITQPLLAP